MTTTGEERNPDTIGLDLVLDALRRDLSVAREAGRENALGLGVVGVEIQLAVTVRREAKGRAKAMVLLPWGSASGELEGAMIRDSVNKITINMMPEGDSSMMGGFGEGRAK